VSGVHTVQFNFPLISPQDAGGYSMSVAAVSVSGPEADDCDIDDDALELIQRLQTLVNAKTADAVRAEAAAAVWDVSATLLQTEFLLRLDFLSISCQLLDHPATCVRVQECVVGTLANMVCVSAGVSALICGATDLAVDPLPITTCLRLLARSRDPPVLVELCRLLQSGLNTAPKWWVPVLHDRSVLLNHVLALAAQAVDGDVLSRTLATVHAWVHHVPTLAQHVAPAPLIALVTQDQPSVSAVMGALRVLDACLTAGPDAPVCRVVATHAPFVSAFARLCADDAYEGVRGPATSILCAFLHHQLAPTIVSTMLAQEPDLIEALMMLPVRCEESDFAVVLQELVHWYVD
jgi:hypothetical protein